MKTAILAGATGLVGGYLLKRLLNDERYSSVIALTRRPLRFTHPRLRPVIFNYEHPDVEVLRGDDLFCALGTTLWKAGSKAAQYRVDVEYPLMLGHLAHTQGVRQYLLVSSAGANARAWSFYLRMKGELEEKLAALGFETFISVRPSLLLGPREEFRLGERIGIVLERFFRPLIPVRYRGIHAQQVAAALVALAHAQLKGMHFVESEQLHLLSKVSQA
ncbi:MAG: NAD-dependent epimerase/dehydratase family protein [Saprospiraceae bacterium]|nr:NAD-dependent epimerase/dehydratase family protein [Saprospiraceae bacterium]MDW8483324.1 NAD-dependent epimerase/dehydratase family protein [Saprospiraceae bacterium]